MAQQNRWLIPRKHLFGNPDKTQARLSPDGLWFSYLAPLAGVLNMWVAPLADPAAARPLTHDTGRGIRSHFWAFTNQHLLFVRDKNGDENWRLYGVELTSGCEHDLTPFAGVQARIVRSSPQRPDEVAISLNRRDPQRHDLYRLNVVNGELHLIEENHAGFVEYLLDEELTPRLAVKSTAAGGSELWRSAADGWQLCQVIGMADALTTYPVALDKTGEQLYWIDSRGRDTGALTLLDLTTGTQTRLAADAQADAGRLLFHPTLRHAQAVEFTALRRHWQILDPAIADDLAYLATVAEGELAIASRTLDDQRWLVVYEPDNGPTRYYCYDRPQRQAHFLFSDRSQLAGLPLARMQPVTLHACDGLALISYYTLPAACGGKPDAPLPLVLLVHGGPWQRDRWGYDPLHQWLANRGYAVLSVNFRGSTGFGKAFINAGNLEWGGKMHDDLLDAVDWAVAQGIADPQRIAIMGASYGGYATLAGLTFTPERFACGIDLVGPSNLVTLLEALPPYWQPLIELFTTRMGDHRHEAGRAFLAQRSPLHFVENIRRPLLIAQGANDPRVKQAESDQIVQAMQARGIPVTYLLYPDEGHGFARPENNLSFYAVVEAFLAQHLGGQCEPLGDDLVDASLQVLAGTITASAA
jgi:dipeptidyl aminopeptidase/acylaminoacyl peptidase